MVLNTPVPNGVEDEILSWEMVVDVVEAEDELRLVVDDAAVGERSEVGTQTEEQRTILASSDTSLGVTISDGDTFVSGVSSITAEHQVVISDVEDEDEEDEAGNDSHNWEEHKHEEGKDYQDGPEHKVGEGNDYFANEHEVNEGNDYALDRGVNTIVAIAEREGKIPPELIHQLSEKMGFERKLAKETIEDLLEAGLTNFDVGMVIEKINCVNKHEVNEGNEYEYEEDSGEDTIVAFAVEEGKIPPKLIYQLSEEMGFERKLVKQTIVDLLEAGSTIIDADMVIGKMMGEEESAVLHPPCDNENNNPLSDAWEHIGMTAHREWDDRGRHVHRRVVGQVQAIGRHAREAWTNVFTGKGGVDEFEDDLDYDVSDARGGCASDRYSSPASTQFHPAATSAKHTFRRANEDNRLMKGVVAVAIIGSATLLALGNPRASLGAMAVAGAGIAAGEAIRMHSSEHTCGTSRDYGTGRGLHLD